MNMTRAILAFFAGALVAGGVVYFATRPKPTADIAVADGPKIVKTEAAPVAAPAPVPAPEPVKVEPKLSPRPVRRPTPSQPKQPLPPPVQTASNADPREPVAAPASPASESVAVPPGPAQPPIPAAQLPPPPPNKVTLNAGTLIPVRLDITVSSDQMAVGDNFTASLEKPLVVDGFVIAERGSRVDGRITEVDRGGRVKGLASIGLELTRLRTSDGQVVRLQTENFKHTAAKDTKGDVEKVAIGAGLGAIIGAIAGGGKGAAIGAGAGGAAGGGAVVATRGKAAVLKAETPITFRTTTAVTLIEKSKG